MIEEKKHFSLLQYGINYDCKKIFSAGQYNPFLNVETFVYKTSCPFKTIEVNLQQEETYVEVAE